MKTICWLTPDSFVDVDKPIIPGLLNYYNIHWIIVLNIGKGRYRESDFEEMRLLYANLEIEFIYIHKIRDVRTIADCIRIRNRILNVKSDLIYIDHPPSVPHMLPIYFSLPKDKTIVTAHDGSVKSIMKPAWLFRWSMKKGYGRLKHVQMYSISQAHEFDKNYPGHNVTIIPLALKDYGEPTCEKRDDCISFVSFGTMHPEKNVGLLIDAADDLFDEGLRGFKVSINGVWRESYNINDRIKHPEIYEINLGSVPNNDIPNLFGRNHYAVYPYKMMSQSGALKVAYNYHNPVICSNLPGFTDEVVNGIDGYIFETENKESLKSVMRECVLKGNKGYHLLRMKMARHIVENYATETIVQNYKIMIDSVLSNI